MKIVTSKASFLTLLLINSMMFAATPQNMRIEIVNNSRRPMTIASGEQGSSKNAKDLKLKSGDKSEALLITNEKYRIFVVVETGNHYEIKYNPDTGMIDITNLKTRQIVQEIPAKANLKYAAILD